MKAILLLILFSAVTIHAQQTRLIPNPIRKIPKWVRTEFVSRHLDDNYAILYKLFPAYLRSDFNGDGRRDVAVQVQDIRSGKIGIAIFHGKYPQAAFVHVDILGAGNRLGSAGDDFKWIDIWRLHSRTAVYSELKETPPKNSGGEAFDLQKRGGKSGYIYWDGKQYRWGEWKQ